MDQNQVRKNQFISHLKKRLFQKLYSKDIFQRNAMTTWKPFCNFLMRLQETQSGDPSISSSGDTSITPSGDTSDTPSGDPLRRPPQETPSGEHLVYPSGDLLRRIIIDSGDCLRRTLRRAFVIPLRRAFSYPLRRPPSGESLLTPSKDPLRRA